jgi:agmatinase
MHADGPLRWAAPRTFFGTPSVSDLDALDAQVAFVGVPYDGGTPEPGVRTGQSLGPAQTRLASYYQFEWRWPPDAAGSGGAAGWYDIEADRQYLSGVTMADVGDIAIQGSDQEGNYERITAVAHSLAERGTLMVAVGGDHSISYPLGRGMEPFGQVDVVNIDAHADFMDEIFGSSLSGASQIRRLAELSFVRSVTELGLRNVEAEEIDGMRELDVHWATSAEVIEHGGAIVDELVPASDALYVSIDIDVLDPSVAPGTTLPEPGGLSYRKLRELLVELARRGRVIGFDVVELNPPHDIGTNTSRLVGWIITHFLSEIFDRPR